MKYALVRVLPEVPPGGVCAGIDRASADHAVCVVDLAGRVAGRLAAAHDRPGIAALIARLRRGGAAGVAIERGDGVLVDALLAAGLTVVVIGSRQVKNLRSRYGSSGAKDDRFDAFVLADTLRTDRARLRPLVPDSPATLALRAAVRARRDLVAHRVSACNQLRAHLAVAFPGAVGLFSALDSPVSLAFLAAFPGQQAAARLDEQVLEAEIAAQLAGLAGVAPVTRRSGTYISHEFRWNVNRQLRDAICDFADGSRHASPWAAAIYAAARDRGKDHPHAVRITARAWVLIIWRCWQDGTSYDPAKHRALQDILTRQAAAGTPQPHR